ncbi:SSH4 [[Candida] subhashii]|uniref:SSH4 n=1 Tax=[Candida] subhashii TaxID=561895 RepID=A0A8J5URZ6_9ASCO|nr:SSH4 [[Candida] subhashii]KAG7665042.1 SSH4 [[Candida] subhashii]
MTQPDPINILLLLVFLSIGVFFILFFCAYRLFFNNSERNDYTLIGSDFMGSSSNDVPREFLNDEESLTHLAETYDFTHLSPEEQSAYLKAEEFTKNHPPDFHKVRGKTFTTEDEKLIKDCGINAFQFDWEEDLLNPRYIVADRTELNFHNNNTPYSTVTAILNYPLPVKNRLYSDTIYFETKIFEFNNNNNPNAHFSIGLVTKPYPNSFRLPGYNKFSIGYESTGNLKINKPFPTPLQQHQGEQSEYNALVLPPLQQSDIVGFGYVITTGTIFITRNGKKILDVMKGCFVDLYPAVGCFSTNAKFQVNLGQLGFVWIEANVRKYGFVSTSDYKKIGGDRGLAALPQYDQAIEDGDKVLDKGEELPPRYPEEELDFFGRSSKDIVRLGSSSKHAAQLNEKPEGDIPDYEIEDEVKEVPQEGSSTKVTNEPEEIMDLRERIYEQHIQNEISEESLPLLAVDSNGSANYESTEYSKQRKSDSENPPASSSTGKTSHKYTESSSAQPQPQQQQPEPTSQPQDQPIQREVSTPIQPQAEPTVPITPDTPTQETTQSPEVQANAEADVEEEESTPQPPSDGSAPASANATPSKSTKPKKKKKKANKKKGKKK